MALTTRIAALVLLAFVLMDLWLSVSGANREMVLAVAMVAVILPTVTEFTGFGFSFKAALQDNNADMERVLLKIEECCAKQEGRASSHPETMRMLTSDLDTELKLEGVAAEVAREQIIGMLQDPAYSMRSIEALSKKTRLDAATVRQLLQTMKGVSPVLRSDGAEFWGLSNRVRYYLRRNN